MTLYQNPDLHMHSTFSDGSDTPEALLAAVRAAGLDVFALTDHDSVAGCLEMQALIAPDDPHFITGVELSCEENGRGCHILGYGCDVSKPSICNALWFTRNERQKKAHNRFAFLAEHCGITFPEEEVNAVLGLYNPGKPHIARLMVKHGYVAAMKDAFPILNLYEGREKKLTPAEGIDAILRADGIPVLAHGILGEGDETLAPEDIADRVRTLKKAGLMGLEAYYSTYTDEQEAVMLALAEENNLLVTAGSDYHGTNKTIALGQTRCPDPARMERFYKMIEFLGK